jgi:hypothetical protein
MKKIRNIFRFLPLLGILLVSSLVVSCELDLQDDPGFINESASGNAPFASISAYDYISTVGSELEMDTDSTFVFSNNFGFNYMKAAIDKVGFVDLYSETVGEGRTFVLLSNLAFTRNNRNQPGVFRTITGSNFNLRVGETAREAVDRIVDTPEAEEIVREILRYHILQEVVVQNTLPRIAVWGTFETLQAAEEGVGFQPMSLARGFDQGLRLNARRTVEINRDQLLPSPQSEFSRTRRADVIQHNIRVSNGVAQTVNGYVFNTAFN